MMPNKTMFMIVTPTNPKKSSLIITNNAFKVKSKCIVLHSQKCQKLKQGISQPCFYFYAVFSSSLNLSAIIAINSEFVGLPFAADTVYPKILSTVSPSPLPHATSIA